MEPGGRETAVRKMEQSGSQAKREDLYAGGGGGGLCRDCEAQLLAEYLRLYAAINRGAALRNAKKRDTARSPQALDALYRPRIEAEQAKRTQAGLRPGGRLARDREHARRGMRGQVT